MTELKLEDLRRVQVQPGDRFVILSADHFSYGTADRIRQHVAAGLGTTPEHVVILDGGVELVVIGQDMPLKGEAPLDLRSMDPVVDLKAAGPVVAGGQSLVSAFLLQEYGTERPGLDDAVNLSRLLDQFVAFAADQLKARVARCSMDVVADAEGPGLRLVDPAG